MLNEIFAAAPTNYSKGAFPEKTVFYFSIDETKKTLICENGSCSVIDGKAVPDADCFCKMSGELFLKIWQEGYKPGMKDFFSGDIKSNAPHLLQQFMKAFGK